MRLSTALLTATLLLAGQARAAGSGCTRPEDRTAFDIEGLKSELMVTALSCRAQDRYNAFMSRYHAEIMTDERAIDAYFKRNYGKLGQRMHDEYITNLANVQSQDQLKDGTAFCENLPILFEEVMALHDGTELDEFANSKPIVQPASFIDCTGSEKATHTTRRARRRTHS